MLPRAVQDKLQALSKTYKLEGNEPKGANGWVFFATNKVTNSRVAIKFYYWGEQPALHAEPRSLAQFDSANIVPILVAELIEDGWACFICPRFASDVEGLMSHGQISIYRAIDICLDALQGVGALHESGIVHRDLKPANILIRDDGIAAIGDFGSVATIDDATGDAPASRHSIIYRPPESFETNRISPLGDLYQIGAVLYELLGGALPKNPLEWMNKTQRLEHDSIESECDQSMFQDQVVGHAITTGRVFKPHSMPFWVSPGIRALVLRQTSISVDRRCPRVGAFMTALLSLRRSTIDWVGTEHGAVGSFAGGAARVVVSGPNVRVELDRGRGFRRDSSLELGNPLQSCQAINQRFT